MTLKHPQAELKTKQAEVKKMDSGYKKDQDTRQAVTSSKEKLKAEIAKPGYQDGKEECLLDQRRQPTVQKPQEEQSYLEYQKLMHEIQHLSRLRGPRE